MANSIQIRTHAYDLTQSQFFSCEFCTTLTHTAIMQLDLCYKTQHHLKQKLILLLYIHKMKNVLLRSCLIDIQLRWQMGCDLFISIYCTKARSVICGIIARALINWYELLNNESEGLKLLCRTIAAVHLDKTTPSRWPKSKPSTRDCSLASCPAWRTEVVKCRLLCVLISQLCWVNSQLALGKR